MPEITFEHPEVEGRITVPIGEGTDPAGPIATYGESGWTPVADDEAADAPVAAAIPEPAKPVAPSPEPDTTKEI